MLRDYFNRFLAQTSENPLGLEISGGEGIYLLGNNRKKYIDLISGISVSNVGHKNTYVLNAIKKQLEVNNHVLVYGEMIIEPQVYLATKLVELLNNNIDNVFFVNSGTEAVEGAIKLAKKFTGRNKIISFSNCYHGSSHLCLSLMHENPMSVAFKPLIPRIYNFQFNTFKSSYFINESIAAVIVEPIQGEAGAIPANIEFLASLREECNKAGALLIFDEVQTGFGRTGNWFAFQNYNINPDIICLAKALGGGMPLGAFAASKNIMSALKSNPPLGHITTFGGHPISCAAAIASINFINDNNLIQSVKVKEKMFRELLKHKLIENISGTGLLLAVHFNNAQIVKSIIAKCIENGLISDWFLFNDKALRIAPPLIISYEEIQKSCGIIIDSLNQI